MPLIPTDSFVEPNQTIGCHCGKEFNGYGNFYKHLDECPLIRCAHCTAVLGDPPYQPIDTHVCPLAELNRLKATIRDNPAEVMKSLLFGKES